MQYEEVVKLIEESEKRVDEVLKAARLQRHERQPMPKDRLELMLNYILGGMAIVFAFILLLVFMYYLNE